MAKFNPDVDYKEELHALRTLYVTATPRLRWHVIEERLSHSEVGPVKLVSVVSGVEALARSLLLEIGAKNGIAKREFYEQSLKHKNADALVEAYFREQLLAEPATYFVDDTWALFQFAVKFRNLIVHECTFLGQDKYPSLIEAADEVLRELAKLGGLQTTLTPN